MSFKHVKDLWNDEIASQLSPVERLVYRSNLLGQDWRITNTGGGNTSSKLIETDPITGEATEVMWVKGSGGDLRTAKVANFASLYHEKLLSLIQIYGKMEPRGIKTPAEDAMVGMYRHCTFNLNPCAPSIDTPLHGFIPAKFVDHTHPVACIAIATSKNGRELTREIYGDRVAWVDWSRPGFELGLEMQQVCAENPNAVGIMMGGHGLINWADSDKAVYHLSLSLIDEAAEYLAKHHKGDLTLGGAKYASLADENRTQILTEIMPWLRGKVSQEKRVIGTVEHNDVIMEFVNSHDAPRLAELGTSCPDHFLRTKIKPLYVDWNAITEDVNTLKSRLEAGLAQYKSDYADYYHTHKHDNSPALRPSDPSVILVPSVGMIAFGKTKSESRVTAEFYNAAVNVILGAEAVSEYTALPRQEAFDIEYWLLEEAKLRRMPPEAELSRKIVAVFGAGSGIGKTTVKRLLKEGAVVAVIDLNAEAAEAVAAEILAERGMGIGVAGSGISGCGDVIGLGCDITNRAQISACFEQIILAYGGLDSVVVTAGLFATPDAAGHISYGAWMKTFAVNTFAPYWIAEEANTIWKAQGLSGTLVATTSANAVVAKKGSVAYDTSKAAANHVLRELAIELAPLVRVNGVAPATVVEGSSMFPRDRVMASLAKYDIAFDEAETTEALRDKLAQFYANRTLTKRPITTADQAEAIFILVSDRLGKTTGQIIPVDGGLIEAFLR